MSNIINISFDVFYDFFKQHSLNYIKYGSFLPEQNDLIKKIHKNLMSDSNPIQIFTAPPASGKTHIICLLTKYFESLNYDIIIIVPTDFFKIDVNRAKSEIKGGIDTDILSLEEYLNCNETYEIAIIDESHNIKSYSNLDSKNVKIMEFDRLNVIYEYLLSSYLTPAKVSIAKQLSHTSAIDLMRYIVKENQYKDIMENILKDPYSWLTFLYLWPGSLYARIKFVRANTFYNFKLPNKHFIMFSATPLTNKELEFYCGIEKEKISRAEPIEAKSEWKNIQKYYISITDITNRIDKIDFLRILLKECNKKSLILFSDKYSCEQVFEELQNDVDNLYIMPPSTNDVDLFNEYVNRKNGILLSSSKIFWEGITIKNLQLLVIFDLPYPEPEIVDLIQNKKIDPSLDIMRRLEQGLGRISRRKDDYAVGITLFDVVKLRYDIPEILLKSSYERLRSWECMLLMHKVFIDETPSLTELCKSIT